MSAAPRALLTFLLVVGCGDPTGSDGGVAPRDAGGADAEPGGSAVDAIVDLGHCFLARRCCVAADCGTDRSWECTLDGYCADLDRTCGCADDLDCVDGSFCFTNAVVCGVCMLPAPACISDANCAGGRCVTGYCVDETMCFDYPAP